MRTPHALLVALLLLCPPAALARQPVADGDGARTAIFALILGVNRSFDPGQPPLRFADDDAARYQDFFRLLGARTYLLSRLDDNTRRLHPQAAAEALEPRWDVLQTQVRQLREDIAQAATRGVEPVLYVVYAGHGDVRDGQGVISLEDVGVTGARLEKDVLAPLKAARIHLIVDACHSYFLAYGRGPGGERRPLAGFAALSPELGRIGRVGLLLSTSSARESHEWEALQAGVFHHEVRSGLMGAADANRDGRVSYREIAAFVQQANAAIPNERYRPEVHARPPEGNDLLVDLRPGLAQRRLEVGGALGGHYVLEDENGVRMAEFHSREGEAVHLLRPGPTARHYLRRTHDGAEFTLPAAPEVVTLGELPESPVRVAQRGAAHEAFSRLFTLPYGPEQVAAYRFPVSLSASEAPGDPGAWRQRAGWGAMGAGAAAGVAALTFTLHGRNLRDQLPARPSQAQVAELNAKLRRTNQAAMLLTGVSAAALASGALLHLWPTGRGGTILAVTPGEGGVGVAGTW